VKKGVLTVRDNEHSVVGSVGDNVLEVAEFGECVGKMRGGVGQLASPIFPMA